MKPSFFSSRRYYLFSLYSVDCFLSTAKEELGGDNLKNIWALEYL
jgi:hypothetical protein